MLGVHAVVDGAVAAWPTYQHDSQRTGADPNQGPVAAVIPAWTSALDGAVYAQPLVVGSAVYAATENNSVYALDTSTGTQLWHQHLATPASLSQLPCGNINRTASPARQSSTPRATCCTW
jgi:hypothetical protein